MRDELIAEVTLDEGGRLLLKPTETLFDDLHMAGAWGFRWDDRTSSLAIPLPKEWSYRDWFDHVVKIIGSQYGIHLKVGRTRDGPPFPLPYVMTLKRQANVSFRVES